MAQEFGTTGSGFTNYEHQAPPNARDSLRNQIFGARESRVGLSRMRDQSFGDVGTQADRQKRRLRGSLSSQIAQGGSQQPMPTFGGALSDALRRTKVRSRIASQGDKAIEQQQLRDRVSIAMAGRQREGQYMQAAANAANIREGVNVGVANANQQIQNANMGMWGSIAGGLAGAVANPEFRNMFRSSPSSNLVMPGDLVPPPPPAMPDGS